MMHVRNLAPPTRLHVHKLLDRLPSLITSRFFSASPSDVFSFGHVDRTVTLELRGLPPLSKARKHKREYASNKRVVDAAVSALPNCDFVALGLGSPELGVISRYLHFRDSKNGDTARRHKFKNERQLLSGYQQYIDVVVGAASAGTKVIGIGRSKQAEAASFGEAAMGNKLEVLRLLSLYLRKGDVLNGPDILEDFKIAAPAIYHAVVGEGAFYCLCRLHENLYNMEENSLCRRKNVKVLVVVDQWLLRDLSHLVRTKLPALIHNNAPPMVDQMHSLDNRSRKGWSRFLLQFVILPLFTFGGFVCYQLYALVSLPIRDLASYALGGPASRWSRRKEADDGRQQALDADESRD